LSNQTIFRAAHKCFELTDSNRVSTLFNKGRRNKGATQEIEQRALYGGYTLQEVQAATVPAPVGRALSRLLGNRLNDFR
jgi:hypothetical protein